MSSAKANLRTPVAVCSVDDLVEGRPLPADLEGRRIIVIRWHRQIYALRDVCPHQRQSLSAGSVRDPVVGGAEVGELTLAPQQPVIVCPWHTWTFGLADGRCSSDARLRVRTYDVHVVDGTVLVSRTRQRRGPHVADGAEDIVTQP